MKYAMLIYETEADFDARTNEPGGDAMDAGRRAVETVARESYGRLVSYLSARSRDVASADDALSQAFLAALRMWPRDGVPARPEAWLMTAARRRLIDRARHEQVRTEAARALQHAVRSAETAADHDEFPDDRLKLLFVCAHPAIDPGVHAPLMLQTALGLTAAGGTMSPAPMQGAMAWPRRRAGCPGRS